MRNFTEQELVRREKANKLFEEGIDAFGHRFDRDSFASEIKEKYESIDHDKFEDMADTAKVAGRIMFRKDGRSIHDILLHTKVVRV